MAHRAVGCVLQSEFDGIPLADADHRAWDGSIIGPIFIADPIGEKPGDGLGFERDVNQCRLVPIDRRRNLRLRHTPEVCGQSGKGRLIRRVGRRSGRGLGLLQLLRKGAGRVPKHAQGGGERRRPHK